MIGAISSGLAVVLLIESLPLGVEAQELQPWVSDCISLRIRKAYAYYNAYTHVVKG